MKVACLWLLSNLATWWLIKSEIRARIISFIYFLKLQRHQITILNTVFKNVGFGFWDSACLKPQLQASRHSLHGWQLPNVCLHSVPGLRSNSSWNKHTLSNKRQRMFAEAFWHYPSYYCNQRQKEETINEWNNVSGLTTSPPLAHPFVLWASL